MTRIVFDSRALRYLDLIKVTRGIEVKIRRKQDSLLMRLLALLFKIFRVDFNQFVTTIGSTIYWPSRLPVIHLGESSIPTLFHETIHIVDYRKNRVGFVLTYASPQIWSIPAFIVGLILSFTGILSAGLVLILLSAVLLFLPSPWRTKYEIRGYAGSVFARCLLDKSWDSAEQLAKDFANMLCSPAYLFPCHGKRKVSEAIYRTALEYRDSDDVPSRELREVL